MHMKWLLAAFLVLLTTPVARADDPAVPSLSIAQTGSVIEDVTIDTHGVTSPRIVSQYLSMHAGDTLSQDGIDRDYGNLVHVAGYGAKLSIADGDKPNTVVLHWDVVSKELAPTVHPYYADKPLTAPFQGVGFIVTSPPVDARGGNFSAFSQLSRRANLFATLVTMPLSVNAHKGLESDFVSTLSFGRGVYRQIYPPNKNVFSWNTSLQADYWLHNANDTQIETGLRYTRSTSALPSGVTSPYIYPTWQRPARTLVAEFGMLHGCVNAAARWYPPFCTFQYRFQISDGLGGFGSTSKYESLSAGAARYFRIGYSALAFQGLISRRGGVLPDSFLSCTGARAYPKSFCGTDSQLIQVEYRLNDALRQNVKFILFLDDAASRIRGEILPQPTSTFQWHDSYGFGIAYRNLIRVDVAYGKPGARITVALEGQTF